MSRTLHVILACISLLGLLLMSPVQGTRATGSNGSWSLTGSMNVGRWVHTATLLGDGNVLVAGGGDSNNTANTAELYDPSSGTWSLTGSLHIARQNHTATLLGNGKVLVSGGYNNGIILASAELYDPSNGTWSLTGSLNVGRYDHTATLLENGNVLVAGGTIGVTNITTTAELYDPSSGVWSLTGSMNEGHTGATATLLGNGNVLVAGGQMLIDSVSITSTAELYTTADTTAPVLQLPSTITVNATSPSGASVTYSVTATDTAYPSNQLTITCSPPTGMMFANGTTTVTCTASDPAGNSAHGSFSVVVVGASGQLIKLMSLVNSFHLKRGIQGRLDTQLYAVQRTVAAGKMMVACQQLAAFNRLDRIFTGHSGLTALQSQQLLAAATTIQKALGC